MFDKPIYMGQCILDNSKSKMCEFLYDFVFPKWGIENVRVCCTDTDSLILEIRTKDLYLQLRMNCKGAPLLVHHSCRTREFCRPRYIFNRPNFQYGLVQRGRLVHSRE